MDLNTSFSAISIGILFFSVFLSLLTKKSKGRLSCLPGPSALPIIGNLHQLGALPHRTLHQMAEKHGPLMSLKLGSLDVVVASSSEVTKQFMKTHDLNFSNRPSSAAGKYLFYNGRDLLTAPHGEYWRDMRKVSVVELLNSKKIDSFGKVMEEEAVAMVRSMWEKSEEGRVGVNVSESVASYVSNTTWRMLTGSTNSNLQSGGMTFGELVTEVTNLMAAVNIGDFFPWLEWADLQGLRQRMKNVHQRLDAVFRKILDDRAERKRRSGAEESDRQKDIVDALVDMDITAEDKTAIIFVMFVGSIDTSTTILEWAMSELLRNPSMMKKLQEEINSIVKDDEKLTYSHISKMEYLHCIVKETLRLYPPVPLIVPRESTEACTVNVLDRDYYIPPKTRLIMNAWAIGRDPRVWKEPLEFRPERFMDKNLDKIKDLESSMIPFGAGRRGCPGSSMGTAVVHVALVHIFHYIDWRIEGDIDMNESYGTTIPRKKHLFGIPSWRLAPSSIKI